MSKVFFSIGLSLDGYMVPRDMDLAHADNLDQQPWFRQWSALTQWMFRQRFFRENLRLGEGGETGPDNALLQSVFSRTGASVMGKRMFDGGERFWPEEAPFHTPVFVVTHEVRGPWIRPGGTTFHFVNDGIEAALRRAREAAGDRDVRVAGGPTLIQQYLRAGLVDEFLLSVAPVLFGGGQQLFEDTGSPSVALAETIASTDVTHLRYTVTDNPNSAGIPPDADPVADGLRRALNSR
jgi:dihydrofolate reductase